MLKISVVIHTAVMSKCVYESKLRVTTLLGSQEQVLLYIRREMDTLHLIIISFTACLYLLVHTAAVSACVCACRLRVKTLVGAQEQVLLYIRREMDTLQSFATMLESELVEHNATIMTAGQLNEYVS